MGENAAHPQLPWRPPQELDGYRLRRLLGRGGMGEVHLADDVLLERKVAIKFIQSTRPDDKQRQMFLTEARAVAKLQHPNVVSIYRVGDADGHPFLITEFVRGLSLDRLPRPLPWQRVLRLGIGLCRGLGAAHRRGILHRDLKPSNAILPDGSDDTEVKLLDFGLAKFLEDGEPFRSADEQPALEPSDPTTVDSPSDTIDVPANPGALSEESPRVFVAPHAAHKSPARAAAAPDAPSDAGAHADTDSSTIKGTPCYMAPEVLRGEPASRRSDVYGLGALLYALCTKGPPFLGLPFLDLVRVVSEIDATPLRAQNSAVEPRFAEVVDRCLRRAPQERYGSASELLSALEALQPGVRQNIVPQGNPYRGLLPFEAEHRAVFFGRDADVGAVIDRLRSEPSMLIAADSGVGKSSLVRAGVLPALLDGALDGNCRWRAVTMVPGRKPYTALLDALSSLLGVAKEVLAQKLLREPGQLLRVLRRYLNPEHGAVLFIDQLEELVTIGDAAQAEWVATAIGALDGALPRFRLLMSARADYLSKLSALPRLGDELQRMLYLLRPLSAERIREVIVGPAECKGVSFESQALIDELAAETGAGLPLLQFALAELWEARQGNLLTRASLIAIGGVSGALARHADCVLAGLSGSKRRLAKPLLLSLVSAEGTRQRRARGELPPDSEELAVLEALIKGRLIVARDGESESTFELAHEALINGWHTLRMWLDEQGEGRLVRQRIEQAAREWQRLGCKREGLWSTRQLREAELIKSMTLSPQELTFLRASRRALLRRRAYFVLGLLMAPLLLAITLGLVQLATERVMGRNQDVRVTQVTTQLAQARSLDEEVKRLRGQAFAAFDRGKLDEGEARWREAELAIKKRRKSITEAVKRLRWAETDNGMRADMRRLVAESWFLQAQISEREYRDDRDQGLARSLRALRLIDKSGEYEQRFMQPTPLRLQTTPPGVEVLVQAEERVEGQRRLGRAHRLGVTPLEAALPLGSGRLILRAPFGRELSYPLYVHRGQPIDLKLDLTPLSRLPAGYIYIPPGRFLFGTQASDEVRIRSLHTVPMHEVETGAYIISQHEITLGEWIEYLEATGLRRAPVGEAQCILDRTQDGTWWLTLRLLPQVYHLRDGEPLYYSVRSRRQVSDWRRLPMLSVTAAEAETYATWLDRTGRVIGARLCSELEWERAARGADERLHPQGDVAELDDANLSDTYGLDVRSSGPDEVGRHAGSRSPFGVEDMIGNAAEWTRSSIEPRSYVLRGGSFYSRRDGLQISARQLAPKDRDLAAGLRICAPPP